MNKEELTFEIGACHGRVNELEKENADLREKYQNLTDASIQLAHDPLPPFLLLSVSISQGLESTQGCWRCSWSFWVNY